MILLQAYQYFNINGDKKMKQTYIRCPRCELNYILKKDKFCNVCKMEMKAQGSMGDEDSADMELCPICKINYITSDEDMCSACAKERDEDEEDTPIAKESIWGYDDEIDDDDGYSDDENGDMVSIGALNPDDDSDMDMDMDDDDEDLGEGFDDDIDDDDEEDSHGDDED